MPRMKHNLGRAFMERGIIWVNIRKHKTNTQLRYTIAHELIHMKYNKLPHGEKFNRLTMNVISNTLDKK